MTVIPDGRRFFIPQGIQELATLHDYQPVNVLLPTFGTAMVRDGNYTDGSGTDNYASFQTILDGCAGTNGITELQVPPGVYRFSQTPTFSSATARVRIKGMGSVLSPLASQPPTFVWSGSAGSTFIDVAAPTQNIPQFAIDNLCLSGRNDGVNLPATLLKFRGTSGAAGLVDTGAILRNLWLQNCSGDAVRFEGGITNAYWENGRIDNCSGYSVYMRGEGNSLTMGGNFTLAMRRPGSGSAPNGMFFLDGESLISGSNYGNSVLKLYGLHLETNDSPNVTFAGGANVFDQRHLIRLGVNVNSDRVQHFVYMDGVELAEPFVDTLGANIASHSFIGITAPTSADSNMDTTRRVCITIHNAKGIARGLTATDAVWFTGLIGGRIHNNERPPATGSGNVGMFSLELGLNTSGEHVWSQVTGRAHYVDGLVKRPRLVAQLPSDWPKPGMEYYVSDSNVSLATGHGSVVSGGGSLTVPVYYDGSNWRIG